MPDILDLNDWTALNHPNFYNAVKYINDCEIFYTAMYQLWIQKGKPDITAIENP